MSERRDSTRSLVSWEKATLAWGSQAQWKGSEATQDGQGTENEANGNVG